jgi:hypothetical protein
MFRAMILVKKIPMLNPEGLLRRIPHDTQYKWHPQEITNYNEPIQIWSSTFSTRIKKLFDIDNEFS